MAFPIAVMRRENAFAYPFLASEGAETAVDWAYENGIRDFVIALGNDEKNIEMANMLIDSFRRSFLKISLENGKFDKHHVKIYVNLIEKRNKALINWRWENDAKTFTRPYEQNEQNQLINCPLLSVVPFGYREEMYSYDSLIEDYRERIYNYGYNLLSSIISAKEDERQSCENAYAEFKKSIGANFDVLRNNEEAIDQWMTISQFIRLSNKSALNFAINYFKYAESRNNNLTAEDWDYMIRLEHERWDRFFIAHGWVYAKYCKFADFTDKTADEKKEIKKKEKESRREVKQHNCLCPFDEMLDEYTKAYDRGNVELGLIKGIVYGK